MDGTHFGLYGTKWAKNMNIESQIDMQMIIVDEFLGFW